MGQGVGDVRADREVLRGEGGGSSRLGGALTLVDVVLLVPPDLLRDGIQGGLTFLEQGLDGDLGVVGPSRQGRALVGEALQPGVARRDCGQPDVDPVRDLGLVLQDALNRVELGQDVLRRGATKQARQEGDVAGTHVEGADLLAQ